MCRTTEKMKVVFQVNFSLSSFREANFEWLQEVEIFLALISGQFNPFPSKSDTYRFYSV